MHNITALTREMTHGGKLQNGVITRRVLITQGSGGAWYEVTMTNTTPLQRVITARREDSTIGHTITERNARRWLHALQNARLGVAA
jgi:hypothetical protein